MRPAESLETSARQPLGPPENPRTRTGRSVPGSIALHAPGAYQDIAAVVEAAHQAGLARKVAMLAPVICIKG